MKFLPELLAVNPTAEEIGLPRVNANDATLSIIATAAFTAIGAVSVIFLLIGAFKYVTSNGDAGQIGKAKNTILYAIIGLIVTALSFTIVQFVLGRVI
jgi:uncharacterized Tic20 family protein